MPRLTSLKPQLTSLPPRLGYQPGDEKAQDKHRNTASPWRAWYNTPRWRKLRQRILIRDCYTCQKTGVLCGDRYPLPRSPVVDHITPHRGDPALFWDEKNLQVVAKSVHDKLIQAEEQKYPTGRWD